MERLYSVTNILRGILLSMIFLFKERRDISIILNNPFANSVFSMSILLVLFGNYKDKLYKEKRAEC